MKLTIITINFNHYEGLKRTIDSIVNQTFTDYEWIVVDGGSTDGSKDLLEQYKDRFAWWCSEPDKGVYNAMNKGLAYATGEYINFMNAGDIFASSTILEEIFSKPHDADVLYGIMTRENVRGAVNNESMMKKHLHWWDFYESTFNHQATFTRGTLFEQYGCFDESYRALADWKHFAELICVHKVTCEFIPMTVAVYEGGGISEDASIWLPEADRLRCELFPTMQRTDYNELCYMSLCQDYWLSRILYKLLNRATKYMVKFFGLKR